MTSCLPLLSLCLDLVLLHIILHLALAVNIVETSAAAAASPGLALLAPLCPLSLGSLASLGALLLGESGLSESSDPFSLGGLSCLSTLQFHSLAALLGSSLLFGDFLFLLLGGPLPLNLKFLFSSSTSLSLLNTLSSLPLQLCNALSLGLLLGSKGLGLSSTSPCLEFALTLSLSSLSSFDSSLSLLLSSGTGKLDCFSSLTSSFLSPSFGKHSLMSPLSFDSSLLSFLSSLFLESKAPKVSGVSPSTRSTNPSPIIMTAAVGLHLSSAGGSSSLTSACSGGSSASSCSLLKS